MKFENMINTITLGDSYKLIKDIPDKSIDLIIIDPPYEYTTGGGAGCFGTKKGSITMNIIKLQQIQIHCRKQKNLKMKVKKSMGR